jgi:hypothetical protein
MFWIKVLFKHVIALLEAASEFVALRRFFFHVLFIGTRRAPLR